MSSATEAVRAAPPPAVLERSVLETVAVERLPAASRVVGLLISTVAVAFCLFHLFGAFFGPPMSFTYLTMHVSFMLVLTFLLKPLGRASWRAPLTLPFALDAALIAAVVAIQVYILVDPFAFMSRRGAADPTDLAIGVLMILIVMEATRRVVGIAMSVLAAFFMLQSASGELFPGIFFGPNVDWSLIINDLFMEEEGIYATPIAISASFVVLFIIFGAFLMRSGVGNLFRDVAFATMGRQVGGPAKAAVVSSAFMSSISGSAVSNVVTTGTFTIPLMKRMGYPARFAGAVEACASTGGVFTPPVMGAVAFIMAEFMGVPYWDIVKAAIIPALLYFAAVFAAVHFRARHLSLRPESKEDLPSARAAFVQYGHMLVPLVLLVGALMVGYSPAFSALIGIGSIVLLSFLRPTTRFTPLRIIATLEDAARMMIFVAIPSAAAGLIVGAIYFSGLAVRFSASIMDMSAGSEILALMLAMVVCIVLGMGVTVTALYILVASLIVPILIRLGVEPIAAHLFAFHFGVHSYITPPVALSAFAAAAIAKTHPMGTAFESARLALPAYLIPYMFVFSTGLVWVGSWSDILLAAVTAFVGVVAIAASVEGYVLRRTTPIERLTLAAGALLLVAPGLVSHAIGALLVGSVLILQAKTPAREGLL
ncbi:MAG: TRAP transporter permease [Pseudomonadota bacterium]